MKFIHSSDLQIGKAFGYSQPETAADQPESFSPRSVMNLDRNVERSRCLYVSTVIPLDRTLPSRHDKSLIALDLFDRGLTTIAV
jgi:hypothetical protein